MASYINGITTYIPQIQPSDVNLQIESQYANMRQSKHDAARQQISNLYGSLLNSPLSREDNNIARDNFFKTIEGDIKRISGMDLSLQQNVTQAQSVFNQLLDDKYILKDMAWTKNFHNQVQISDYLKNVCTDSAECDGMWWDGGDRLLQYQMEDFQNATADDSLRMGDAHYIAKQDVTRMALDFAKQYDVDMTVEQSNGQYIFTQKNGQIAAPVYSAMFNGMIAQNPKVMEYYNAKARVQRLDYMHQHAEEFGSMEAAEQDYINKMLIEMSTVRDDNGNAIQSSSPEQRIREDAENAKTQAERKQAQAAGLQVTASQIQDENKSAVIAQSADKLSQQAMFYEREYDRNNNVVKRINRDANNQIVSGAQIDEMLAKYNMDYDIGSAVLMASLMNSSVTMREDKYGLERYKASLAAQKQKQTSNVSDEGYRGLYAETGNEDMGGGELKEGADVLKPIVENNQSTLDAYKTAVKDLKDEIGDVSEEQKKAFAKTLDYVEEIANNSDLSKNIIQGSMLNVSDDKLAEIDKSIETLNQLSNATGLNMQKFTHVKEKLDRVRGKYKELLNIKKVSLDLNDEILQKIDSMDYEEGDNQAQMVKNLLTNLKNGNVKDFSTTEFAKAMHIGSGFEQFATDDFWKFFTISDSYNDYKMSVGEAISLFNTLSDQNTADWDQGQLAKELYEQIANKSDVDASGKYSKNWFENAVEGVYGGIRAVDRILESGIKGIGYVSGLSRIPGFDNFVENIIPLGDELVENEPNKNFDFKVGGKSIYVLDENGNKKRDENGNYVFTDEAKRVLSKQISIKLDKDLHDDFVRHDEAVIKGDKEFEQEYTDWSELWLTGFSSEDVLVNFHELTNDIAKEYGLLTYHMNDIFGVDSNGSKWTKTHHIYVTNNENDKATEVVYNTLKDLDVSNVTITNTLQTNYEDATDEYQNLQKVLEDNNISEREFLDACASVVSDMAQEPKTNKDGSRRQFDTDVKGSVTYSAIALRDPEFSVMKLSPEISQKVFKRLDLKTDDLSGNGIYLYNHHQNQNYSVLDTYYTHSNLAVMVDTLGKHGKWYNGLDTEFADNVNVIASDSGYIFTADIPVGINKDGSLKTQTFQESGYALRNGFDRAWEAFERKLREINEAFKIQYNIAI